MKILRPALLAALLLTSLPLGACNRGAGANDGHSGFTNLRDARREERRAARRAERGGGQGGDREARRAQRRAERERAGAPASPPAQ